jgi:hypothetical protein
VDHLHPGTLIFRAFTSLHAPRDEILTLPYFRKKNLT